MTEPRYQLTFVESPGILVSLVRQIRERLRGPKITVPAHYYRGTEASSSRTPASKPARTNDLSEPQYRLTFVESPGILVSLVRQIRERLREPKITVPPQYYRGEVELPVAEMRPWYRELPLQIKTLFEKPRPLVLTSRPVEVPDIWQDYRQQPGSWVNSLLVHILVLVGLLLPFAISRMLTPVKASNQYDVVNISPYLPELPPSAKKAGGGGGGGDRSPTPASKGVVPRFAKEQLAPPMANIRNLTARLQVQPNLLGPPDLKLPQMTNGQWGDPQGVLGPSSNGPGTGGGIGSGEGTGIGPGKGGGLGPGEGGGVGGGVYSVGGSVSAPVPIYSPDPPYSEEARKAKYSGIVVVSIIVDAQGNVHDVQIVKPLGLGLDEKAVETIRTWRFKPALRNNAPVAVRMLVEVSFRLF